MCRGFRGIEVPCVKSKPQRTFSLPTATADNLSKDITLAWINCGVFGLFGSVLDLALVPSFTLVLVVSRCLEVAAAAARFLRSENSVYTRTL